MTELLFRDDAYLKSCEAEVVSAGPEGLRLDRTVFYAESGGQPGDSGTLTWDGGQARVVDTRKGDGPEDIVHLLEEGAPVPPPGTRVTAEIDWARRHRHMRIHTCMHLLCSLVEGDVTGGQIGDGKGRLDFNVPGAALDKEALTEGLNRLIAEDHPVRPRWVTDAELEADPNLVRTMSVRPPSGSGRVRLLEIEGVDLQACGGTHVAHTGEIGRVEIGKIENKGRQNRRVNIRFAEG
ncbi:misacylated tRNA(Ala) deacylase [Tistlia consotensis]|uniref:Alanine--tRNA ligase n=1 Tax=Tistlia consotensis USBA 355 TaxID=560819 RepID=A0A1Y6BCU6_9PROT|nr:alanyl-tRNA editing protein [Tistlia consotensis]SMF04878.1 misacylated tRNA(Ala) deacylase [Tistlia consotensis USBA 355]SNR54886.1 misacylated tRNA(Ala) deacylase [Tistlia consotensis]